MKQALYFLPIALFVVLGVFLYRGISLDPTDVPSPLIDKPLPAFALRELNSGIELTEQSLQGQVFLLNVWATWCVSCRMEHPYLMELAKKGIIIVGLDYKDEDDKARAWLKELGNPYQHVLVDATGKLGMDLGVFGAPETYLVDKHGIIRYKRVGVIDERVWQQEIVSRYTQLQQP